MKTIVIVGGGYAGINLVDSLKKEWKEEMGITLQVILIDKHEYHFRKVLLVKAITEHTDELNIKIPFDTYIDKGISFMQGEFIQLKEEEKKVVIKQARDEVIEVDYDMLAMTLGSKVKDQHAFTGGVILKDLASAQQMREQLDHIMQERKTDNINKEKNVNIALVGGGITGIETACELAVWLKKQYRSNGMNEDKVNVLLIDSHSHLLHQAPHHISLKLQKRMRKLGVTFMPNSRVKQYKAGSLLCENGTEINVDYCMVSAGVEVNPIVKELQLPLTKQGQLIVNDYYQVEGRNDIFAIGDCAQIIDAVSHEADGMTCKEAIPQAQRLAKTMQNMMHHSSHPIAHKSMPVTLFCVSIGPKDGFVWIQKWGMNFTITGSLGLKLREYTWKSASLV
ncbi:NAD(P)/FAD-dependent oxidoreductase [Longirhabdus pacifica]|uniref:NAD(P)/FAD-dependent oxidoreductase n=1 Tax=Longirhabdus pacifica TaxID=2305227 RepID=UPI001008A73D|nr:FAD-dependent oxidoreductase [Longirhabdus pacifica]